MKVARLSDEAKEDLVQIWEYIAHDNIDAADRLIQAIVAQYRTLADFPKLGRLRDELMPDIRSYIVGQYVLFYRPAANGIDVLRILHGARDLKSVLESEPGQTFRLDLPDV